jgi:hypothetical protein
MATTVYESIVLDVPAADAWVTVCNLDFGYLPTVQSAVLANNAHPHDVGGVRTITYHDGTVQKIKLTEYSEARCEMSWDLIESNPSAHAMSVSWTLKMTAVKWPKAQVFVEWTADFSRDASNEVLMDAKFKGKENLIFIRQATKQRLIAEEKKRGTLPKLQRQLSEKSAMMFQAFQKLDKNGNGKLEFEEFAVAVNKLFGADLPERALRIILMDADLDGSNDISFEEFCTFLGRHTDDDSSAKDSKDSKESKDSKSSKKHESKATPAKTKVAASASAPASASAGAGASASASAAPSKK